MATPTTKRDPSNISYAALTGATVTVIFLTILIAWAEFQPGLKDWLKTTFTHHWVGKSLLGAAVFCLSGVLASVGQPKSEAQVAQAGRSLYWTTIIGAIGLTVFFFFEAFLK